MHYFLVCLNEEDCGQTEQYEQEPITGICKYCSGPAIWYTAQYYLDNIYNKYKISRDEDTEET